jgi:hypothetical protein
VVYSEDEFEEENIVERENDEYDDEDDAGDGEEWEDVDSNAEEGVEDI